MLKYIKIKNYLSFKDETFITFESNSRGNKKDNVFSEKNTVLNKSMLIYGANASGKTNILKAIDFIKYVALSSFQGLYPCDPFLLDKDTIEQPSYFEIGFIEDNQEYCYKFSIFKGVFLDESLIKVKELSNVILFNRVKGQDKIICNDKTFEKEIQKGEGKVKDNVSFLSVLGQWNGQINGKPIGSFFEKISIIPSNMDIPLINPSFTIEFLKLREKKNIDIAVEFLRCADIFIDDIKLEEIESDVTQMNGIPLPPTEKMRLKSTLIKIGRKVNNSDEIQYFNFNIESGGTKKLFTIFGMILDTILNEKILFIDEVESNLHIHILRNVFNLIHSNLERKYQFICTTHSTELMDLGQFKKSQIGITQKRKNNSTEFYTLEKFQDIRTENDIKKLYNIGALGGTPIVSDLTPIIEQLKLGKEN